MQEPDKQTNTSRQKDDFTDNIKLQQILIYDPIKVCNLGLNKIKLIRVWLRQFISFHLISPDEVYHGIVECNRSLGANDDDVVGYLSPDECTFYLLI